MSVTTAQTEGAILRITFVEMLFALAVGQVGIRAADLASMEGSNRFVGVSHLILGLVVIAASWFGWQRSAVRSARQEVERLFSVAFLGLLLDVGLVIIYFILVQELDIDSTDGVATISPNASPEAFWILVIFISYFVWDIVTDVLSPGSMPSQSTLARKISLWARVVVACTACSFVAALLSCLVLIAARRCSSPKSVVFLDIALLAVVLLFRVLKPVLEPRVVAWLRVTDCAAFKVTRSTDGNETRWMTGLFFAYFVALISAT